MSSLSPVEGKAFQLVSGTCRVRAKQMSDVLNLLATPPLSAGRPHGGLEPAPPPRPLLARALSVIVLSQYQRAEN